MTAASSHWVHDLDPVLVHVGPIPIRYYSLGYLGGLVLGMWLLQWLARRRRIALTKEQVSDLVLVYVLLGIIIGGRLGYCLFYDPGRFLSNPAEIIKVWKGGMASHGGILGVAIAVWLDTTSPTCLETAFMANSFSLMAGRSASVSSEVFLPRPSATMPMIGR